jgi:hypothetical protein
MNGLMSSKGLEQCLEESNYTFPCKFDALEFLTIQQQLNQSIRGVASFLSSPSYQSLWAIMAGVSGG